MIDVEKTTRLKQVYSDLPLEQQLRLLASLALNITVSARGSYPSQENEDDHETIKNSLAEIIGFNEIQQTVTGQLGRMIDGDKNRYPDDVFMAILLEETKNTRWGKGLLSALEFSFNRLGVSLE
ncbi:MAG TPA: hypothetical protein VI260_15255 [Blastocatellia bacterium]|jgi:hypothetical protein